MSSESLMPMGSPNLDLQGSPSFILLLKMCLWGLSFSGKDSDLPLQRAQVWSLIRELRSHMLCDVAKRWEFSCPPVGEPLGVFLFSSDVLVWGSLGLSWWPFVSQVFPWELLTGTPLKHHGAQKTLLCYKELVSWRDWSLMGSDLSHYGVSLDFMGQLHTTVVCVFSYFLTDKEGGIFSQFCGW